MSIRIEGMDGKDRQVSGDYWKVTEVGSLQIFKKSESYYVPVDYSCVPYVPPPNIVLEVAPGRWASVDHAHDN